VSFCISGLSRLQRLPSNSFHVDGNAVIRNGVGYDWYNDSDGFINPKRKSYTSTMLNSLLGPASGYTIPPSKDIHNFKPKNNSHPLLTPSSPATPPILRPQISLQRMKLLHHSSKYASQKLLGLGESQIRKERIPLPVDHQIPRNNSPRESCYHLSCHFVGLMCRDRRMLDLRQPRAVYLPGLEIFVFQGCYLEWLACLVERRRD
jgi:hypothetical protein